MIKKIKNILCVGLMALVVSCGTDNLEPTLEQIKDISSIANVDDLYGLLKGGLNRMTTSDYYGRDFIITDEIRGDNVFPNGNSGRFQAQGGLTYIPSNNMGIWTRAYALIAVCNVIIGADVATLEGDQDRAKHIQGQAYFLRALAHFDLLRNYGQQYVNGAQPLGVSLVDEFAGEDQIPARSSITETVNFVYDDLNTAFSMMNDQYDIDQQFPTRMAAKAIESRVAIYMGDWSRAQSAAEAVMSSNKYSVIPETDYVSSFAQDNSSNSIFELAFSVVDNSGNGGLGFIYRGDVYGDVQVISGVGDIYDAGDVRANILGMELGLLRNLGKYPDLQGADNVGVIRYEEVVLNYAEALFEQNDMPRSIIALNSITSKRGASAYTGTITKDDILNERRKELIFEGFRFFDLSRTGRAIPLVSIEQSIPSAIPAGDHRYALPIPLVEMDANSNMKQNMGY